MTAITMTKVIGHCRLYDKFSYSVKLFYPKAVRVKRSYSFWFRSVWQTGYFFMLLFYLLSFFKINFFKRIFQEHHQNGKQLGCRSGPTIRSNFCFKPNCTFIDKTLHHVVSRLVYTVCHWPFWVKRVAREFHGLAISLPWNRICYLPWTTVRFWELENEKVLMLRRCVMRHLDTLLWRFGGDCCRSSHAIMPAA